MSGTGWGSCRGCTRTSRPTATSGPGRGELVHIDVKKLGKIGRPGHRVNNDRRTRSRRIGWEFVHVAVDDATRLAYVEVLADEKGQTAAGFLRRAVAFFRRYGIRVERVPGWLDWYNRLRPHRSLGRKPPLSRLAEMNNVVGTNS